MNQEAWYEKLPNYWKNKKLKYVVNLRNERFMGDNVENYVGLENIESMTGKYIPNKNSELTIEGTSIRFYKGDILFGKLRPYLSKCIEADFDGVGSTELLVLNTKDDFIISKFLKYIMLSPKFIDIINSSTYGTKMPRANWNFIGNIEIPLPSLKQQHNIVNFIEVKLNKIDKLISQKEKLILLLELQRQAIITEAVTKGLNPNVKMQDSGVEWIGEIPEHWVVKPLYSLYKENKLKNKGNEIKNVLSLSYGKIKRRDVESNYGLLPDSFETYQILQKGDIVLRLTDLQNDKKSLRVGLVNEEGIITSAYLGLKQSEKLVSEYTYYLLHSYDLMKVFYGLGSGVRQSMSYTEIKKLPILLPPLEEQQEIVEFLRVKVHENETLVEMLKKVIEKLKEYRQSLIYEAVTGKIDVSDMEVD